MTQVSWWNRALEYLRQGEIRRIFDDIPVGVPADQFLTRLEERLDAIMSEGVQLIVRSLPLERVEVQLNICYFNAWGEIRSVDTFARQVERIGARYPDLKHVVVQQMADEMRHFKLYNAAAVKMGGQDVLSTSPEEKAGSLYQMFEYCDHRCSEDVREQIFSCQFVDERFPLHLFAAVKDVPNLHPEFHRALEQIVPDEKFHVRGVGRMAAEMLAAEGEAAQRRMLDLAARILPYTLADKSANLMG
jgi:hypothetical protein